MCEWIMNECVNELLFIFYLMNKYKNILFVKEIELRLFLFNIKYKYICYKIFLNIITHRSV